MEDPLRPRTGGRGGSAVGDVVFDNFQERITIVLLQIEAPADYKIVEHANAPFARNQTVPINPALLLLHHNPLKRWYFLTFLKPKPPGIGLVIRFLRRVCQCIASRKDCQLRSSQLQGKKWRRFRQPKRN